tara:strand:- start:3528 stop:6140 length:2613 start_codon:yes stop_codon:yes gene_type:complete
MKNNIFKFTLLFFFLIISTYSYGFDEFNFDVTEIIIIENGNKFIGKKRGTITSDNGIIIKADEFEYFKKLNILKANGNVKIIDEVNKYEIFTKNIVYEKNDSLIYTKNGSKAVDLINQVVITADTFEYNLLEDKILAKKNSILQNNLKDYKILSEFISYDRKNKQVYSKGKTKAFINSEYVFESSNVYFNMDKMELFSKEKTKITDRFNLYKLEKFNYLINKEELKGEKIIIKTKYNLPDSDKFYFSSAILNLKKQIFSGTDVKLNLNKNIFENPRNDPRIMGVSASSNNKVTKINKAIFTSCAQNKKCTPWSIKAKEIIHNKDKKEIIYNSASLRIYDFPILYFPKFFHPDPTVNRRSGLLQPKINNSNILGNSFSIPYYSVLAENKDFTFIPYIFDNNLQMLQNEFRQVNKYSKLFANFGVVNNYKSTTDSKKNSIFNLFANFDFDLDLDNFISSNLLMSIEKVNNDTFLKIFDTHLQDSMLKPDDNDNLKNEIKLSLNSDKYILETGFQSYENLQKNNNDRYEYVLPYYNLTSNLSDDFLNGSVAFSSTGENILNNTNVLKSNIINNINYNSVDFSFIDGLKSNFGVNIKNLNSLGKNNSEYKSSPQIELISEFSLKNNFPLYKRSKNHFNYLVPKILFKINPSDMKNYQNSDRTINVGNIFNDNRLGINDTLETGKSMTIGVDYKKENLKDLNKFFEIKLATVLRDKEEKTIPQKTTLNKKNSNIFGSITNNFSNFFNIEYKFAVDKNLDNIEYNDFSTEFNLSNFTTKFSFLEERGEMGQSNFLENNTSFMFDEQNYISFKTRRNRKLNLTEYYDLVYEYKNDCLTAGIKYKKTYYEDRDLKPSENLFFTLSLIPLTSYEQKIDR